MRQVIRTTRARIVAIGAAGIFAATGCAEHAIRMDSAGGDVDLNRKAAADLASPQSQASLASNLYLLTGSPSGSTVFNPRTSFASALSAAYVYSDYDVDGRIALTDAVVAAIDEHAPSTASISLSAPLSRRTVPWSAALERSLPNAGWDHLDIYAEMTDPRQVRQIHLAPPSGSNGADLYFDDGHLIFARFGPTTPLGLSTGRPSAGDRYYFGEDGMIAWIRPTGLRPSPMTDEFLAATSEILGVADAVYGAATAPPAKK